MKSSPTAPFDGQTIRIQLDGISLTGYPCDVEQLFAVAPPAHLAAAVGGYGQFSSWDSNFEPTASPEPFPSRMPERPASCNESAPLLRLRLLPNRQRPPRTPTAMRLCHVIRQPPGGSLRSLTVG